MKVSERILIRDHKTYGQLERENAELQAEVSRLRGLVSELVKALNAHKHTDGCWCEAAFSMPDGSHPRHSIECEASQDATAKAQEVYGE